MPVENVNTFFGTCWWEREAFRDTLVYHKLRGRLRQENAQGLCEGVERFVVQDVLVAEGVHACSSLCPSIGLVVPDFLQPRRFSLRNVFA